MTTTETGARQMLAYVTDQGTAMSETARCTTCQATITRQAADMLSPELAGDWDQGNVHDCTGNEALECQLCGWSSPVLAAP